MTDNKHKRKSQETHERREGHPRTLASAQPQPISYRLTAEQLDRAGRMGLVWPLQPVVALPSGGPLMSANTPWEYWNAGYHVRDGYFQQLDQDNKRYQERIKSLEEFAKHDRREKDQLRARVGKFLQEQYKTQAGAPNMTAPDDRLRGNEAKLKAEVDRLMAEMDRLMAENVKLKADAVHRDAQLALLKVQETMLRNHIPGGNGTRHDGTQDTPYLDTTSSPQEPTPPSSSSTMSAELHFPNNGTPQQSGEAGQTDQEVAINADGVVADLSTMNFNSVGFHPDGGLYTSPPLTGQATWNGNPAWMDALCQMQQNIDLAAFDPHGGPHISLPSTHDSWGGNSPFAGGPGQMQQDINSAASGSYAVPHNSFPLNGYYPQNGNVNWAGTAGQTQPDMLQQPFYVMAPSLGAQAVGSFVDLSGPELYLPAQSALDTNFMSTSAAGIAFTGDLTDGAEFIDLEGGADGNAVVAEDAALLAVPAVPAVQTFSDPFHELGHSGL